MGSYQEKLEPENVKKRQWVPLLPQEIIAIVTREPGSTNVVTTNKKLRVAV